MKKILIKLARTSTNLDIQKKLFEMADQDPDIWWALKSNKLLELKLREGLHKYLGYEY
jgi:hypothetical protein